jgi:hypothetical protein
MEDGTTSVKSFFRLIQKAYPTLYVRYVCEGDSSPINGQDFTDGLKRSIEDAKRSGFLLIFNADTRSDDQSITICRPISMDKCTLWKIKITYQLISSQMIDVAGIDPSEGLDMFAKIFIDGLSSDELVVELSETNARNLVAKLTYDLGSYKTVGSFEVG